MANIGAVGAQDKLPVKSQPAVKKDNQAPKEPKDKVQISKTRDIFEKVLGAPVAAVTSVANAAGGLISGGVSGVEGDGDDAHVVTSGIGYVAMGATAGAMLMGGWIPAVAGGVVGLVFAGLAAGSGSAEKIGEKIEASAEKVVADNEPSGRKLKDATRDFTEGGLTGLGVGAVEGFKEGDAYGAGIVSGVTEGTKGFVTSALGKYEDAKEARPKQKKSLFKKILGVPRKVLGATAGVVGGLVGMAMEAPDGLMQGTVVGAAENEEASKKFHGGLMRLESLLAGAGAGFAMGGPWGAAIGAGVGLVGGHILRRVEKKSGKDKEIAQNLTKAVRYAQKDNAYKMETDEYGYRDKTPYETFRDGVEGAITGTGAGLREGFKGGYAAGKGTVDGVFDGIMGIVGAFTGR